MMNFLKQCCRYVKILINNLKNVLFALISYISHKIIIYLSFFILIYYYFNIFSNKDTQQMFLLDFVKKVWLKIIKSNKYLYTKYIINIESKFP